MYLDTADKRCVLMLRTWTWGLVTWNPWSRIRICNDRDQSGSGHREDQCHPQDGSGSSWGWTSPSDGRCHDHGQGSSCGDPTGPSARATVDRPAWAVSSRKWSIVDTHPSGATPSGNQSATDTHPAGAGSYGNQFKADRPAGQFPPGNGLPWTPLLLVPIPLGTGLLQLNLLLGLAHLPGEELTWSACVLLGSSPTEASLLWMQVQLGPAPRGSGLRRTGLREFSWVFLRWKGSYYEPVLLGLFLLGFRLLHMIRRALDPPRTRRALSDSELSWVRRAGGEATTSQESRPAGPSPLGNQATTDRLLGPGSSWNWTTAGTRVGLPLGMDWPGGPAGPAPDTCLATTGADTMRDWSSWNRMDGNSVLD